MKKGIEKAFKKICKVHKDKKDKLNLFFYSTDKFFTIKKR